MKISAIVALFVTVAVVSASTGGKKVKKVPVKPQGPRTPLGFLLSLINVIRELGNQDFENPENVLKKVEFKMNPNSGFAMEDFDWKRLPPQDSEALDQAWVISMGGNPLMKDALKVYKKTGRAPRRWTRSQFEKYIQAFIARILFELRGGSVYVNLGEFEEGAIGTKGEIITKKPGQSKFKN